MANETDTKRLLEQRNALRKPAFVVKESHFKAGVKPNWRRPRGKHSPVRQCHKGRIKMPHPGYGAPKAAYGLTRTGRVPKQVMNLADLENIDKERDAVIIASSVGLRKRIALLSVCKEKGLTLEGALDLKAEMSKCDRQFADSKKITTARRKEKQSKVKTAVAVGTDKGLVTVM